jgi:hypothetical protein
MSTKIATTINTDRADNPPFNIVIVGGGTAGWMTANLMAQAWSEQQVKITVIESPSIGIIGVGEGSTPQLKSFFDQIGITEEQWMPKCNATYKNGILFNGWSARPNAESYFHPFSSLIDAHTAPAFTYNSLFRRRGFDVDCHPDRFFLSAKLAQRQQAPIGDYNFPFDISYGYHFDAVLLGKYLAEIAKIKNVKHIVGTVKSAELVTQTRDNLALEVGDIASLCLDNNEKIKADLFVDCSGFKGLLIQETLQVPFVSFNENLFNDSAVTIALPRNKKTKKINAQTISTAMKHGWAWDIPLTNRSGNGYVYSSSYCTAAEAEQELREKLGSASEGIAAKHLKMKVGRVEKHWHKNCVAIGLSQGFIEPLEATALHFVQETIENFINVFSKNNFSRLEQSLFNQKLNARFEGIRDYIVAHYRLSAREDTPYWRECGANPNISNTLKKIVQSWVKGDDLNKTLTQPNIVSFYPPISWHAILAGYGVFPPLLVDEPTSSLARKYDLLHIDQFIERCSNNFQDHTSFLKQRGELT